MHLSSVTIYFVTGKIPVWIYSPFSLSASLMVDSYGDLVAATVNRATVNVGG